MGHVNRFYRDQMTSFCIILANLLSNIHIKRNQYSWFKLEAAAAAEWPQSCLTPCDRLDRSPPGSAVPGILQARTLKWVAISFFNAWKWKVKVKSLSRVRLFATPWTAAYQAPLPVGFYRQEYWSGLPSPSPKLEASPCQRVHEIYSHNCWFKIYVAFPIITQIQDLYDWLEVYP